MNVKAGKLDKITGFQNLFSQLPNFGFSFVSPPWIWLWGYAFFITGLVVYPYLNNFQALSSEMGFQIGQISIFLGFQILIHLCWFFIGKSHIKLKPVLIFASFVQILAMGLVFWEIIALNLGL